MAVAAASWSPTMTRLIESICYSQENVAALQDPEEARFKSVSMCSQTVCNFFGIYHFVQATIGVQFFAEATIRIYFLLFEANKSFFFLVEASIGILKYINGLCVSLTV